ncbi:hypothetical protein PL75_01195 [Neisseria arctica]|uniref:Uncharacterized protein n=2 Tax=Neisseria arctica TaxID=1470200 RepID=A0A0J1C5X9_9NEIS|nr:hypothetical protein PL75_01195 [Neisseria arctica]
MNVILNAVSTMTSKNQTTNSESEGKALGLEKQDKLCFSVLEGGQVLLEKDVIDEECGTDPAISSFLGFLEKSMQSSLESIRPASTFCYARYRQLAGD